VPPARDHDMQRYCTLITLIFPELNLTLTDIKLVPVADLPLQSVLTFQPCPSEPAVTFLQCLCVTQGYAIPRDKLIQLYETTYIVQSMDLPDAPLNPRTEPPPLPDLRRSITQLQLICADATHEAKVPQEAQGAAENFPSLPMTISAKSSAGVSETTTEELWRWATIYTDCVSYTDSYLCRAPLDGHEVRATEHIFLAAFLTVHYSRPCRTTYPNVCLTMSWVIAY
jgi:hypothetical protein